MKKEYKEFIDKVNLKNYEIKNGWLVVNGDLDCS